MRNLFFTLILVCSAYHSLQAQEKGKFRLDISLGYAAVPEGDSGGLLLYLEPKWTLNDYMNVGIRVGGAAIGKNLDDSNDSRIPEVGVSASYIATFDYYFHKSGSPFAPFAGVGFGYHDVGNFDTDTPSGNTTVLDNDGRFGGLVRVGFDWSKFRLGVEYNIVPTSDLRDLENNVIGTSKNSYYGISLGFYFGGGKWNRS